MLISTTNQAFRSGLIMDPWFKHCPDGVLQEVRNLFSSYDMSSNQSFLALTLYDLKEEKDVDMSVTIEYIKTLAPLISPTEEIIFLNWW